MRLRALAGAYAGEVRDYSFPAAQAALAAGTAERLDRPVQSVTSSLASRVASTSQTVAAQPVPKQRRVRYGT